jgi:hypothetical protein
MTEANVQPQQILCLEHDTTILYGEAIQIVAERNLCWFRPLLLCRVQDEAEILLDLRQGADLLCPFSLLRNALDMELLPLLVQLERLKAEPAEPGLLHQIHPDATAHQQLQQFVRQVWQAHPEAF